MTDTNTTSSPTYTDTLWDNLQKTVARCPHWAEVRYHHRRSRALRVRKGEMENLSSSHYEGVGLRVLVNGTWGFASSSDLSLTGLEQALQDAERMAHELNSRKKQKVQIASTTKLAQGRFFVPGYDELWSMPLGEKLAFVKDSEAEIRQAAEKVEAAICQYTELFEDKIIMTSDGANCHIKLARPEVYMIAFGADGTRHSTGLESVGGTGSWECLFFNQPAESMISQAAEEAVVLLSAPEGPGGRKKVVLSPAMVGLLSHEAIGHTVEADLVKGGSVAKGKIGETVASSLVTLCDSGISEYNEGAGGILPVDDEGVLCEKTEIIKEGKLVSYLHNRESAAEHGVEPTGNARAWEFSDEPIIRMRNTYIAPGDDELDSMINGIEDGYFIDGPMGGQADTTGEFMFGAQKVRRIVNGKLGESVKNLTVSGNAFDVLKSVDAVSKDFQWGVGSGHCGKGQPAKVDAGGPYIRCELLVGGAQS